MEFRTQYYILVNTYEALHSEASEYNTELSCPCKVKLTKRGAFGVFTPKLCHSFSSVRSSNSTVIKLIIKKHHMSKSLPTRFSVYHSCFPKSVNSLASTPAGLKTI